MDMKNKIATRAEWKKVYEEIFHFTPKRQRGTKHAIKHLRGRAKMIQMKFFAEVENFETPGTGQSRRQQHEN